MKTEIKIQIDKVTNGYWVVVNDDKYIATKQKVSAQACDVLDKVIRQHANDSSIGITINVDTEE